MLQLIFPLVLAMEVASVALEPGRYDLEYFGEDVGIEQEIELVNFRGRQKTGSFDVRISSKGGLSRSAEDSQIIRGIYFTDALAPDELAPIKDEEIPALTSSRKWIPIFQIVIPKAGVMNVGAIKLVGINIETDGSYIGVVHSLAQRKGTAKMDPCRFRMKRIAR